MTRFAEMQRKIKPRKTGTNPNPGTCRKYRRTVRGEASTYFLKGLARPLRRPKEHMEHAAHDFGGHRAEAIEAADRAIQQLELSSKYDKDYPASEPQIAYRNSISGK
jgi:hypothetical protein